MVKFFPESASSWTIKRPEHEKKTRPLRYDGTYRCPACRHGHIAELPLMEAMACDFCRHIFTLNLSSQSIQVVDSSQPMSWRWNGRKWVAAYHDDQQLSVLIWILCGGLVVFPALIVWIAAYVFPPLPDSPWAQFSTLWAVSAFGLHLAMVGWMLAEYYQVPFYVSNKIRLQRLFRAAR